MTVQAHATIEMEPQGEALAALLEERADRLSRRRAENTKPLSRTPILVMRCQNERYGLPLAGLLAVTPWRDCTTIPCAPPEFLGLASAHGEIWAVFDLAGLLTAGPRAGPGPVVLLRHQRRRIALRIDETEQIRALADGDLARHDGPTAQTHLISGMTADKVAVIALDALWSHPAFSEIA